MSLSTAALAVLVEKGLSASDILEVALANDTRADPTAAERMRRYRAKKNGVTVTRNVTDERPLNDINSKPPVFDVSNETSAVSDFAAEVVEDWNREIHGTPLPKARKLSADRRKDLNARAKTHGRDAVFAAIRGMCRSDFHSGKSGQWMAGTLGWVLENNRNFEKMMDLGLATASQQPSSGKQWTPEERAEYLAGLERREAEQAPIRPPDEPPRNRSGPRPIGQVVRITNQSQDQAA